MTIVKPLVLSFSLLAFAGANAYANEASKNQSGAGASTAASAKQGFAELDTNNDGSLSRMEAAADAGAKSSFEKLDGNQDQKLSRSEYESARGQQAAQRRGELRASNLQGMQVVNGKGEEIGEIGDLVINLNSGRVHAAVLEFGGVLGVGEENYAFPISQLKPGKQADQVVMNIDKKALENRDGFSKSQWPGMDDQYWGRVGGKQAGAGSGAQAGKMNLIRSSELIGKEVQDNSGKQVGEVQDVVVGLQNGDVKNIVLRVQDGGRASVPMKSIKASGTEDRLVLSMDAQQLKQKAQKSGKSRAQGGAAGGASGEQEQPSGSGK